MRTFLLLVPVFLFVVACGGKAGPDKDKDGYGANIDCAPDDPNVHPGLKEICNGKDDNCDGNIDEGVDAPFYEDKDGDGYGATATEIRACEAPEGMVPLGGDCDDGDARFHPNADESDCTDPTDYNCDGSSGYEDNDGDGWAACAECDDGDASVNPGASEVCNGVDDDCNGVIDDNATGGSTFYADNDGDGYGDAANTVTDCEAPEGYVTDATDCDDTRGDINPGATEECDGLDNDCDGVVPEDEVDADGDLFRVCQGDCDDSSAAIYPLASDAACDGLDTNCLYDGDEVDDDGDGSFECAGDCDDADPLVEGLDADGDGQTTCGDDCSDTDTSTTCNVDCDDGNPLTGEASVS